MYKIVSKYIKDLSFEISGAKTYFLLQKDIKDFLVNFDIQSKKINQNVKYFLTCLFLNLIVITGIYMGMKDIDFILRVTLDRVLFQTSGFYLILFFV